MTVGKRIKERRQELKMSADELAEKLGKNRATIYRYERGDIENLPLDILDPLAKALNTTPAWIMGWEQETNNNSNTNDIDVQYVGSVGEVIRSLRLLKHISLEEFSNDTGIPLEQLKKYESGKSEIPKSVIETLANFLDVTVDDLTSANITVNRTHMAYISNSPTHVRHLRLWYDAMGDVVLKDEELEKIIEYAKFILTLRDE